MRLPNAWRYRLEKNTRLDVPLMLPVITDHAGDGMVFTVTDDFDGANAFYLVTMHTNWPPGMVLVDGGDVEIGQVGVAVPVHTNFISAFWMDATETTKAQWDEVYHWALTNGYDFQYSGSGKASNHPVQMVNWYDCVKWCNARSQKEGLDPCYYLNFARLA